MDLWWLDVWRPGTASCESWLLNLWPDHSWLMNGFVNNISHIDLTDKYPIWECVPAGMKLWHQSSSPDNSDSSANHCQVFEPYSYACELIKDRHNGSLTDMLAATIITGWLNASYGHSKKRPRSSLNPILNTSSLSYSLGILCANPFTLTRPCEL